MTRVRHHWSNLRSTFWLLPAAMVVAAALLAGLTLSLDAALPAMELPYWVFAGGVAGAYALLSTIAGSMITVAGLGYSITIVALVMASTQFGPRLLNLFIRDRSSQLTLGMFAGTFTFCVLVLRSIRQPADDGTAFVPQVSITVAMGMTVLAVAALIYFFHHIAVSIQAPKVAATVAHDLDEAIDHMRSGGYGRKGPEPEPGQIPSLASDRVVLAGSSGYVQVVDDAALFNAARDHDACIYLVTRPGLFVVKGNPIAIVRGGAPPEELDHHVRSTVIVGDARTPEDDIEYSMRQLVEVALRALSPAINDPFTAMTAIDWLGAALTRLAQAEFAPPYRYDDVGRLRVVASVSTFRGVTHTIFSRIRHYGGSSPVVLGRLLEAIAAFGPHIKDDADRALVHAEADSVREMGHGLLTNAADLAELDRRYRAAVEALTRPE